MTTLSAMQSPTPVTFTIQNHPLLHNILNLSRIQSVSNFLFSGDPLPVSPFASIDLLHNAFLCDVITRPVQPSVLRPNPNNPTLSSHHDSQSVDARFMFVPAFTTGALTVGVGVYQALANLTPPYESKSLSSSNPSMLNLRFVFDAAAHTNLFIVDCPEQDSFLMYYMHHSHPTCCTASMASVSRSKFLRATSLSPTSLALLHILPAYNFIITYSLYRSCPYCRASYSEHCLCTFPHIPPKCFYPAMQQIHGSFDGFASKISIPTVDSAAPPTPQVTLGFTHRYQFQDPVPLMHALWLWALASASPANPRDSLQPSRYGDCNHDFQNSQIEYSVPSAVSGTCVSGVHHQDASTALNELLTALGEPAGEKGLPKTVESVLVFGEGADITSGVGSFVAEKGLETSECGPPPSVAGPHSLRRWGDQSRCTALSSGMISTYDESAFAERAWASTGSRSTRRVEARHSLTMQPSTGTPMNEISNEDDVGSIIKRLKATERKFRNRESAQRSNKRKRELLAAIEKELQYTQNKVKELQVRRKRLEEENSKLRRILRWSMM